MYFVIISLMNKRLNKSLLVFFVAIIIASNFAFAEETSSSTPATTTPSQLEITVPISKDDFLLFYGITKDVDTNNKIDSLRKDFIDKFQTLKDNYKKSITETIAENNLISPVQLESKETSKIVSQVKKIDPKTLIKKYSLKTEKTPAVEVTMSPIINTIDTSSSEIHTENSSWFHKIKSIFNW